MISRCSTCDKPESFRVVATHEDMNARPPIQHTLAICENCNEIALFYREDLGDGFENDSFYRLYPPQPREISYALPENIRAAWDEAILCERGKAWTAAAIMAGKALEAVTKGYDSGSKNVRSTLQKMLAEGAITHEVMEWADGLPILENIGTLSARDRISANDARSLLDFLQAVLEITYDVRPRFKEWQATHPSDGNGRRPAAPAAQPAAASA